MTIKEVEQYLEIPRATVRFYEKEGLLVPQRAENGYREYSDEDIVRLKKIIILRKLGISVSEIEDVLDGARPMSEVISNNIANLEKQMEELKGALSICHKLQDNCEELETFDVDKYWNAMGEEEKKGNRFIDIAKDVVHFEKATMLEYFGLADINGNLTVSVPKATFTIFATMIVAGCLVCIMNKEWSIQHFAGGIRGIVIIMLVECIIGLPVYLLGKKYPKVAKHKVKILVGVCLVLCLVLIVIGNVLGE